MERAASADCVYDPEVLSAIAENCQSLTTLHLNFDHVPNMASFEHLCCVNASTLLHLSLKGVVLTKALSRACAVCINLLTLYYDCSIANTTSIIQSLWQTCPSLRTMQFEQRVL